LNKFVRIGLPSLLGTLRAGKKEFPGSGLKKCDLIVYLFMGSETTGRASNAHNRFS
jgi:hypothetical protein